MPNRPPFKRGDPRAKTAGAKGGRASAASRAASRLGEVQKVLDALAPLTVLDWMDRRGQTGDSWALQRMVAKVLDGTRLSDDELALYREVSGRTTVPKNPRWLWEIFGRRTGKSDFAATLVIHASTKRYSQLKAGEKGRALLLAQNRESTDVLFGYVAGAFDNDPDLSRLVVSRTKDTLTLAHGIVIQVATSNFRASRGFTAIIIVPDESSFWWNEADAANPDKEVLRALRPSLATTRGRMICVTTPFARRGAAWEAYQRYFGQEDESVLVLNAPTLRVNPTIDPAEIALDEAEDPEHASAEWGGQWRSDKEGYVRVEALDAVTDKGITERPPQPNVKRYRAAVDVAGGSGKDSYTLSIGHIEDDRWIQDVLREWKPPFSPGEVTAEVAGICSVYGVREVVGDRYAGGFPPEEFHRHGIKYVQAPRDASSYYVDALALLNTQRVRLLDDAKMRRQFTALRREHHSGGNTKVTHPPNSHDDLSNVTAIGMVEALGLSPTRKRRYLAYSFGDGVVSSDPRLRQRADARTARERQQWEALGALATATLDRHTRQDAADKRLEQKFDDAPMRSAPVWRVHKS